MFKRVIFETADEFFEACDPTGKRKPDVPDTVYVVFDGEMDPRLSGDGHGQFGLENISQSDMTKAAFRLLASRVKIT